MIDQCGMLSDLHLNVTDESESVQVKLNEIKSNYESIFSWDIYNRTGKNGDLATDFIDQIGEKCDMFIENNHFSLYR